MGLDPIWLGVMIAVNLQTSFLTPPFGFALFYLRGVAPPSVTTMHIYRGIVPFVIIQIIGLMLVAAFQATATWLPGFLFPYTTRWRWHRNVARQTAATSISEEGRRGNPQASFFVSAPS